MEQVIPSRTSRWTEAEYLVMEEASPVKHEFRNGQVIDMAGGTLEHGLIAANLLGELRNRFKEKPCIAVGSDMRVRISETGHYCYPDVSVVCGPPVFHPADRRTNLVNPQVLIEVTSASTASNDWADKFYDYMRIETLREYVLVSQDRPRVHTFYRQSDGVWAIGPFFARQEESLKFRSLNIELPLSEIYGGVAFATP